MIKTGNQDVKYSPAVTTGIIPVTSTKQRLFLIGRVYYSDCYVSVSSTKDTQKR